ncbi:MAG TPA: chloride channel protein [Solirubrobacteraceae bacterium]|nr:chloride channel protein [Solirubrobacteraceae bacterium]
MTTTTADRNDAQRPPAELDPERAAEMMTSRRFVVLLVVVAIVGIIVSLVAWCFLEGIYQLDRELYVHLPSALGYDHGPPLWWPLPVLGLAGVVVALAITRLPGDGGHLPAKGLAIGGGTPRPINLPGVIVAGLVTVGSGVVLGPEAPLIALGSGVAVLTVSLARRTTPPQVVTVVAAAGGFAALSFIFDSPLIAAVLLIEATAIGGARQALILVPGLLAAGVGTLVSIGMGSFTGLSSSSYALSALQLPHFGHPDIAQFGWTIALAAAIAVAARIVMLGGLGTHRIVSRRLMMLVPAAGLVVAGLAIAFHGATGHSVDEALFSGQDALGGLVAHAGTWSLSALALLIAFKGVAYGVSLGSFRGGPTFPALFLGAAGGILAAHLPGFSLTPAVAVGMGAATAAVLRLPLSAAILATFLTVSAGTGDEPLIIVGVVTAYLVTVALQRAPGQGRA